MTQLTDLLRFVRRLLKRRATSPHRCRNCPAMHHHQRELDQLRLLVRLQWVAIGLIIAVTAWVTLNRS